jgi:histidyl-tRNA synthetase
MEKFTAPKGTRDFAPGELEVRGAIFNKIQNIFNLYGYKGWDGPIIENIETLTNKSGDAVKEQIYNFKDKGDREIGLRFDLTTSLARIIANNPNIKKPIKTFNFGKVFRYERPQMGRYREFYQMDADIFGSSSRLAECELLSLVIRALKSLGFEKFKIILNDRELLSEILSFCGVESSKSDVLRVMDKKDKISKDEFNKELKDLSLSIDQVEKLNSILEFKGSNQEKLNFIQNYLGEETEPIKNLKQILNVLKDFNDIIDIDFSLVRGQDYYTGTIFEYKILDNEGVGSVGGGGRYDKYVESFGGQPTFAVGASFGIERLIDVIENNAELKKKLLNSKVGVFVATMSSDQTIDALKIVDILRDNGISTSYDLSQRPYKKQFEYALDENFNYLITIGSNEVNNKIYPLKNLETKEEVKLSIDEIIKFLKK